MKGVIYFVFLISWIVYSITIFGFSKPEKPVQEISSIEVQDVAQYAGEKIDYGEIAKAKDLSVGAFFKQFFLSTPIVVTDTVSCMQPDFFRHYKERPNENWTVPYELTYQYNYVPPMIMELQSDFVEVITNGIPPYPSYFYINTLIVGGLEGQGTARMEYDIDSECFFSMGNPILNQHHDHKLSLNPMVQDKPTDTGPGPIGVAFNGVALFDAYARGWGDGWSAESDAFDTEVDTFDHTLAHPQQQGEYHYHVDITGCDDCTYAVDGVGVFPVKAVQPKRDALIGFILDGFPIYGPKEQSTGLLIKDVDLDSCRGHVGQTDEFGFVYHYHMKPFEDIQLNEDDAYMIGCFSGKPSAVKKPKKHRDGKRLPKKGGLRYEQRPPSDAFDAPPPFSEQPGYDEPPPM